MHVIRLPQRWAIVGWTALLLMLLLIVLLGWQHGSVDNIRQMIRLTARSSFLLFACAFVAAPLRQRWQNRGSDWISANRRYFGLAFALSHALHGVLVISFATLDPALFQQRVNTATYWLGGIGYLFIAALAVTSFDKIAALLGRRNWQRLHWLGAHYIWLQFSVSFARRAPGDAFYWPWALAALALLALRLYCRHAPEASRQRALVRG